jgi:hypothetical protein
MADVPQIALPIRFVNGRMAEVEQDSPAEIEQCIQTICSYRPGDREERPDFGIDDQTFREGGVDLNKLKQEVERFEPRADTVFAEAWEYENLIERIRTSNNYNEDVNG